MLRRSLFVLPLLLTAAAAGAQPFPPAATDTPPPAADAPRPRRNKVNVADQRWDDLTPRQRRKIQQRMAGTGNPALTAEDARQRWDSMDPRGRRSATRRSSEDRQRTDRNDRTDRTNRPPRDTMTQ